MLNIVSGTSKSPFFVVGYVVAFLAFSWRRSIQHVRNVQKALVDMKTQEGSKVANSSDKITFISKKGELLVIAMI